MALLTATAPKLPPITMITGLSGVKSKDLSPAALSPCLNSSLIGEPVNTAFPSGSDAAVSGKLWQMTLAPFMAILLARPGVMSDSCIITGILYFFAARTTGTDTKPPFEKTIDGL